MTAKNGAYSSYLQQFSHWTKSSLIIQISINSYQIVENSLLSYTIKTKNESWKERKKTCDPLNLNFHKQSKILYEKLHSLKENIGIKLFTTQMKKNQTLSTWHH